MRRWDEVVCQNLARGDYIPAHGFIQDQREFRPDSIDANAIREPMARARFGTTDLCLPPSVWCKACRLSLAVPREPRREFSVLAKPALRATWNARCAPAWPVAVLIFLLLAFGSLAIRAASPQDAAEFVPDGSPTASLATRLIPLYYARDAERVIATVRGSAESATRPSAPPRSRTSTWYPTCRRRTWPPSRSARVSC